MSEVLGLLPEIAGVTGYIGGQVVAEVAGRFGDAKREAAVHTQGVTAQEYQDYLHQSSRGQSGMTPPVAQPTEEGTTLGKWFDRATRPVAVAMSISALLLAANVHQEPPHRVANPILEVDVDHPWDAIGDGSITRINNMATAFENSGRLQVSAQVAEDSTAYSTTLPNLLTAKEAPNDASSLPQAYSNSIDSATTSLHTTRGLKPNAGLLVITDDDPLGSPTSTTQSIVNKANGLPVSIVNEGEGTDPNAQELQAIAAQTHGHYYDASTKPSAVVRDMEHDIRAKAEALPAPQEDTLWLKIVTLMSWGLTAKLISRRAELQWRGKLRPSKGQ